MCFTTEEIKTDLNTVYVVYFDGQPVGGVTNLFCDLLWHEDKEVAQSVVNQLNKENPRPNMRYFVVPSWEFWHNEMHYMSTKEKEQHAIELEFDV